MSFNGYEHFKGKMTSSALPIISSFSVIFTVLVNVAVVLVSFALMGILSILFGNPNFKAMIMEILLYALISMGVGIWKVWNGMKCSDAIAPQKGHDEENPMIEKEPQTQVVI